MHYFYKQGDFYSLDMRKLANCLEEAFGVATNSGARIEIHGYVCNDTYDLLGHVTAKGFVPQEETLPEVKQAFAKLQHKLEKGETR